MGLARNAFLLVFGLLAGSFLGVVLSWLVLPFATLTETGEAAVPAPDIVVPWAAMAPLYAAAGVLFVVTVAIVTRQVRRAGISTVLRSGEVGGVDQPRVAPLPRRPVAVLGLIVLVLVAAVCAAGAAPLRPLR